MRFTRTGSQAPVSAKRMGLMTRAVRASATANGMTPPAAIKPIGDEISLALLVMPRAPPSSMLVGAVVREPQRPMLAVANKAQNFSDRRVCGRQRLHRAQPLGKNAGAVKQLLIERTYGSEPLAGKFAALHADEIEAFEAGVLAIDQTKWDHVAADAANAADHRLRPDPDELVNCRQAAHVDKIADLAMAA